MKKSINFAENGILVRNENTERYRIEMGRYKPLSDGEVVNLIAAAQKGDRAALNKVVNANLRIVWSIAKRYANMWEFEDCLQEGNMGLIAAVNTFDVSRETKFSTWVLEKVREQINIGITEKSRVVRMHLGQVKEKKSYIAASMDAPLASDEDGEKTLADTFASDSKADSLTKVMDMQTQISSLLSGLEKREQTIICGLFGIGCAEVSEYTLSKKFGITEERVRQIKWEALKKMQQMG